MFQTISMDLRPHDALRKCPMLRHRDRNQRSVDHRLDEGHSKRPPQDKRSPFRRVRSPSRPRVSSSFRPSFIRDDRVFRKPNFSFGFQRYNHFTPRPQYSWRDQPGPRPSSSTLPPSSQNVSKQRTAKSSSPATSKEHSSTHRLSKGSSREKEKPSLSITVSQDTKGGEKESRERVREIPSTVSRAAARNRAIQEKRREIEEVYRQDCDTFGVVVRMLIAKDPSLELSIQTSLQDNLKEIGLRCVDAMQQFITDYDSKEPSPM
ncbi:periphilin-1-like isoform X2 [Hypomesus transpacificus]|uniref:periphilin-1-like isoform X2 n=1 Tax=Hypomesus transpacificus TaxID=137520 RepID=UPI001F082D1B|nr:periphilin-1-like isoform X2 [Hypomesus transpacificus]